MSNNHIVVENPIAKEVVNLPIINRVVKLFSVLFWSYVIIKIFFFDIDVYLFNKFLPQFSGLLNYKFLFLISIFALTLLMVRRKIVILWTVYVFLFPIILICWKTPYFIFKQKSWVLAIALINSIIAFFISFKHTFIISVVYILCAVLIFKSSSTYYLYGSAIFILITLIITFFNRVIMIFKPSKVNIAYINFLSRPIEHTFVPQFKLDENIKNLPLNELSEKQLEKWTGNLQNIVFYNRIYLFMAKKIKNYQESKLNYAFYAFTTFGLIMLTVISFSLINFALYKINLNSFKVIAEPEFFTFFYYSFNNLLFNAVDEIKPINMYTQAISMIESFLALFMGMIFVSLMFSAKSARHTRELDLVILKFETQGKGFESFIRSEYKINTIEEALEELQKVQAVFIKFLYKLSESIK